MGDIAIVGLVLGSLAIYFGRGLYVEAQGLTVRVNEPKVAQKSPNRQPRPRKRKK